MIKIIVGSPCERVGVTRGIGHIVSPWWFLGGGVVADVAIRVAVCVYSIVWGIAVTIDGIAFLHDDLPRCPTDSPPRVPLAR